ncbi:MAG: hypothetical protein ABSA09_06625 [Desulfobaccales bacterium]|jgi:hypothetical protein
MVYYKAGRMHPAFEDFLKTVALGEALRQALAPLAEKGKLAFVLGPPARGRETPQSDIDLPGSWAQLGLSQGENLIK